MVDVNQREATGEPVCHDARLYVSGAVDGYDVRLCEAEDAGQLQYLQRCDLTAQRDRLEPQPRVVFDPARQLASRVADERHLVAAFRHAEREVGRPRLGPAPLSGRVYIDDPHSTPVSTRSTPVMAARTGRLLHQTSS